MNYKHMNTALTLRLIVFFLTAAGVVISFSAKNYFIFTTLLFAAIIEGYSLIVYVNGINRKLTFFFDAIRNEDTTLVFPENIKNKSLKELHCSMNNVNRLITDIKIKSENNELFFRELVEHSSTGLISVDSDGYIDVINQSAKNYIGLPYIANVNLLQQKNRVIYDTMNIIKTGEKRSVKMVLRNEIVHLSIQSSELTFGDKKYKLYSIQDIKKELEENELDSWQKLISVMTHEIMNSIAPITSLSNTLIRFFKNDGQPKLPEELSEEMISHTLEGLSVIEERGKGLMHFVENYRKLAKIPQPTFRAVVIKDWINSIILLFQQELKEQDINLSVKISTEAEELLTDEKLLNQVMINLMKNAMDAVKSCSSKSITIGFAPTKKGGLRIDVEDNGIGIEPKVLNQIFIPFFTTKEDGNGIGLSLSRQIVHRLNGVISVTSKVDQGSKFSMEF